jgi:ParB-like chromosome segregation protein Spo0J
VRRGKPLPPLSSEELARLRADIAADGVRVPVEVCAETGELLDGEHRRAIAAELGVPCPEARVPGLGTEAEREAWAIRANLNRRNMSAEQRAAVRERQVELAAELAAMGRAQEAIGAALGVAQSTVSEWLGRSIEPDSSSETAAEPTPKPKASKTKQSHRLTREARESVWRAHLAGVPARQNAADHGVTDRTVRGIAAKRQKQEEAREQERREAEEAAERLRSATVAHADWRDWLPEQPECDLLLTDPPYSTELDDVAAFAAEWLPAALAKVRPTGRAYVFVGAYPAELLAYLSVALPDQVLAWTYRNTLGPSPADRYALNWQAILYYKGPEAKRLRGESMVERLAAQDVPAPDGRRGPGRHHAWEKPLELAERIVLQATRPGELVLDPFAGTGTFLLAAVANGREALGCEADAAMLEVALGRGLRATSEHPGCVRQPPSAAARRGPSPS